MLFPQHTLNSRARDQKDVLSTTQERKNGEALCGCPPLCDSTADEDDPIKPVDLVLAGRRQESKTAKRTRYRKALLVAALVAGDQLHVAVIDGDGTPRTWSSQKRQTRVGLIRSVSMEALHDTRKHAACSLPFAELRTKELEGEYNSGPEA